MLDDERFGGAGSRPDGSGPDESTLEHFTGFADRSNFPATPGVPEGVSDLGTRDGGAPERTMDSRADTTRWNRLIRLLGPIHGQAVATARRLCRSVDDGDDLYQEAVLRAYYKLHGLREESRFRSWFFAVLLSKHRSHLRRPRRTGVPIEEAFDHGNDPVGEDGTSREEERRRAQRAARALAGLKPEQREAIVLHEIEGFSLEEIADMQRVTLSAVKSRLTRGREKLRRFYLCHARENETAQSRETLTAGTMAWSAKERSHER
jgi:RNA polymerase sigma-70 factor (ECF subfamily)